MMSQGMQEYLRTCICSTLQLHDHEAEIWGLCEQTFNLQQECHDLFPMLSPIHSPLHRPNHSYLTDPFQDFPDLIGSDHTQLNPLGLTLSHPLIQPSKGTLTALGMYRSCRSCVHHMTIAQPCTTCATPSAGHLAGRLGT